MISDGMVRGLKDFFKDYKGCRNCKHQPEPLQMCEWGKHRDHVELICSGWERRKQMTLEEAIQHCKEKATGSCACADDHRQLAEWLIELAERRKAEQSEIIRCKDCKWKHKHYCTRAVEIFISDENYCSWAERRSDGSN